MGVRIGILIAPIIADALGMANLQHFLDTLKTQTAENKLWWITEWRDCGTITAAEVDLLIEHNRLESTR